MNRQVMIETSINANAQCIMDIDRERDKKHEKERSFKISRVVTKRQHNAQVSSAYNEIDSAGTRVESLVQAHGAS